PLGWKPVSSALGSGRNFTRSLGTVIESVLDWIRGTSLFFESLSSWKNPVEEILIVSRFAVVTSFGFRSRLLRPRIAASRTGGAPWLMLICNARVRSITTLVGSYCRPHALNRLGKSD